MLADPDILAVDICAPTLAHHDLAIAALRAGKHVLCEKPFARTAAQAREMAAVAAESNRILMPAMCLRFFPEWVWVKTAIADGRFGQVLSARFRRVAEPPGWGQQNFLDGAKSGGALLDLHIHDTDFVQFCFGRPRAVRSSGHTKISGAIDHVVTEYEVAGGAMVHAEGAWCMTPGFGFNMSYTVNFERATVDYDLARGADALKVCEAGQAAQVLKLGQPDGYVGELRHFAECIANDTQPSIVTAADGVSSMEICEAEERSVRTRQRIELA
jgi:predicted dehydrogenase